MCCDGKPPATAMRSTRLGRCWDPQFPVEMLQACCPLCEAQLGSTPWLTLRHAPRQVWGWLEGGTVGQQPQPTHAFFGSPSPGFPLQPAAAEQEERQSAAAAPEALPPSAAAAASATVDMPRGEPALHAQQPDVWNCTDMPSRWSTGIESLNPPWVRSTAAPSARSVTLAASPAPPRLHVQHQQAGMILQGW